MQQLTIISAVRPRPETSGPSRLQGGQATLRQKNSEVVKMYIGCLQHPHRPAKNCAEIFSSACGVPRTLQDWLPLPIQDNGLEGRHPQVRHVVGYASQRSRVPPKILQNDQGQALSPQQKGVPIGVVVNSAFGHCPTKTHWAPLPFSRSEPRLARCIICTVPIPAPLEGGHQRLSK